MAAKLGKCKNCGSLILVDTKKDQAHCVFCNCVFPKQEAFDLYENDEGHTYLNEQQPEYNGPQLSPVGQQKVVFNNVSKKGNKQTDTTADKPVFKAQNKKLPNTKLSSSQRVKFLAVIVLIIVAFFAVTLPFVIPRDRVRSQLNDEFSKVLSANTDLKADQLSLGQNFDIQRGDNSLVTVVVQKADQALVAKLFDEYCRLRSEVLGDDKTDYSAVTMRVYSTSDSFEIDRPQSDNYAENIKIIE